MSQAALILGKVIAVKPRRRLSAATLLPIAEVTEDGSRWSPPYQELHRRELFPNAGRISWIEPPDEAAVGTYWVFLTEVQPTYFDDATDPHRDRYRVACDNGVRSWPRPATEVIDVDALGGEPAGREALTQSGILLTPGGQTSFHLKWGSLITATPLRFQKLDATRWIVDPVECKQEMEWRELPEPEVIVESPDVPKKCFLVPDFVPSGSRVTRDWSSDEDVCKHVLATLKKWDRDFAQSLELSDRVITRLATLLTTSTTPHNIDFHRHRLERFRRCLERARAEDRLVETARSIIEHGPLSEVVEKQKAELLVELRRATEASLAAEYQEKKAQVDSLEATRRKKETELKALDDQLGARRKALSGQVEEFESEIESRVKKATERPGTILADIALARVFARLLQPQAEASTPQVDLVTSGHSEAPWIDNETSVLSALEKTFACHEVPLDLVRPLHATFLAGVVPLLAGPRAYDALAAYARAICADRIHWVPVSATCLDLLDLFGRVDSNSQRFLAASGNLVGFLREVRASEAMHVVVLDGVTRGSADSYLLPLLDCVTDAMVGVPSRELNLLPPEVRSSDGRDPQLSAFRWPTNVLLAGIVRQGMSSFSPPNELWTRAAFFMPDACATKTCRPDSVHPDAWAAQKRSLPVTRVSRTSWTAWQTARQSVTLTDHARFWSVANAPKVESAVRQVFLRLFAASSKCTDDSKAALGAAVSATLLPVLRANPAALTPLWDPTTCLYPDLRLACEQAVEWLG